jgi:CHAT domain-containing protein
VNPSRVEELCQESTRLLRSNLDAAEKCAQSAMELADASGTAEDLGKAQRCLAIVDWARARYEPALERFQHSLAAFAAIGDELEEARTRSNAIQTLIYLSRYNEALDWAAQARLIFEKHGEWLRLARLDGNVANLLYRQDRFEESMQLYDLVEERFRQFGEARDVAAVLRNKAVCQLSLSRFEEALSTHQQARQYCLANGMPTLAAEADYNIAYLHFLRGDYLLARRLYETARDAARQAGDAYHQALCDLDQAEMFLELNLWEEAERMARRARRAFCRLRLGYESAKAQAFIGICIGRQGDLDAALRHLGKARKTFSAEKNAVWPALIDLYAALLLDQGGQRQRSATRCLRAVGFFSQTVLPAKALECRLLLARIDTDRGLLHRARSHIAAAERLLPFAQSPLLAGHTCNAAARIEEASRNPVHAEKLYRQAQNEFEQIRDRLGAEHLRISFFEDKLSAYESHFRMLFEAKRLPAAFAVAERAKARVLATASAPRRTLRHAANQEGQRLDAECNALQRQLGAAQLNGKPVHSIQARLNSTKIALRHLHESAGNDALASSPPSTPLSIEQLAQSLPEQSAVIEYFCAGSHFYAFLITAGTYQAFRLGEVAAVTEQVRFLQFQMANIAAPFAAARPLDDTIRHLAALYDLLLRPLAPWLPPGHCTFIPHGILHSLPFQALHDGRAFLGQQHTVSVAPSAALYLQALRPPLPVRRGSGSAIFGVGDVATPFILEEARSVAALTPGSSLFLNQAASIAQLAESSSHAAHLHIATHATFRRDNPWFSALRMGDGELGLYDLYELQTPAELIVLSGCGTGLSVVQGGDEPIGLIRGILQAGARSALVSLWNVSDHSTTAFMDSFYRHSLAGHTLALSVQHAQANVASLNPHPFHWAAFSLVGFHGAMAWQPKRPIE